MSGHSVLIVRYIVVSVEIAMIGSNCNSGCHIANSMLLQLPNKANVSRLAVYGLIDLLFGTSPGLVRLL